MTGLERYLSELSALLPGPARRRQRVVDELRDHLLCAYEARVAAGEEVNEAAAATLASAGDPVTVAAAFARSRAQATWARAERFAIASVLAFGALFAAATQLGGSSPLAQGAAAAVGWFAAQIAAVAIGIAWVRGRRLSAGAVTAGRVTMALRAGAVSVACAAIVLALDALALATTSHPSGATIAAVAVTALATIAAAVLVARASLAVRTLRRLEVDGSQTSALDDVRWLLGRFEAIDRSLTWAERHRAGTALLVAAAAGGALALASVAEHGLAHPLLTAAAAGVIFVLEAAAVVLCAYLFDRPLGLWPAA